MTLALRQSAGTALEVEALQTQGLLQRRLGNAAAATRSFRASLALARQSNDRFLESTDLLNLGLTALQAERIAEALDLFDASTRAADSVHALVILQTDVGNAGWAHYRLGDFQQALESFQRARTLATALGALDSEVLWLRSEGLSFARLGQPAQAEECYIQAIRQSDATHNLSQSAASHTALGLLLLDRGRYEQAAEHAQQAQSDARLAQDPAILIDANLLTGLVEEHRGDFEQASLTLNALYPHTVGTPSIRWETEDALANLAANRRQPAQAEHWYRRAAHTFETQRASLASEEFRLPFVANGDALYRDHAAFLIAAGKPVGALRVIDDARARTLREGLTASTPSKASLPAALDPRAVAARQNATLLAYSPGTPVSWLWAVTAHEVRLFTLPSESELAAHLHAWQAAILRSSDPLQERNPDAQWLYANLVAPAAALIPPGSRVITIPGGVLTSLNFETLLVPAQPSRDPHYWIDDVTLSTASSIRLLASARPQPKSSAASQRLLLLGDTLTAGTGYQPLANAATEVRLIGRRFPAGRLVTGSQATPAAYAASSPLQFDFIHFATHATASSTLPLDSAIILSPPASDNDDFRLYAREIIRHPIHAQLVTLSACYGAGSRSVAGEGLVGLSWAFLRAGAHRVIGALWEVNDASTPQLMDELYRQLSLGRTPEDSLRAAKLSLLHSSSVYRKPLYWAVFQLYTGS